MSLITLLEAKQELRVTHDQDDVLIQSYLDAAEDEALRFMDRAEFGTICPCDVTSSSSSGSSSSSSEIVIPPSVRSAVLLLVRARYGATTPDEIKGYRQAAETLLMPYRCGLGV